MNSNKEALTAYHFAETTRKATPLNSSGNSRYKKSFHNFLSVEIKMAEFLLGMITCNLYLQFALPVFHVIKTSIDPAGTNYCMLSAMMNGLPLVIHTVEDDMFRLSNCCF